VAIYFIVFNGEFSVSENIADEFRNVKVGASYFWEPFCLHEMSIDDTWHDFAIKLRNKQEEMRLVYKFIRREK